MSEHPLSLQVERSIYFIRGARVMLAPHLAELYQVETKALNRAVKRNLERFPVDFMFQLTPAEWESLKYQFGTSKQGGIRRAPPTLSPNKALPCFRASCGANVRCR